MSPAPRFIGFSTTTVESAGTSTVFNLIVNSVDDEPFVDNFIEETGINEITVPEQFIGRSFRDLNLRKNYLVNVLAAGPQEQLTVNPPAKYILERGNILVVMGKTADLQKLPQN